MSEYIEVGQPLQFTDPNTPTRVGEIVENVSDIYNIPTPCVGMQVFVKSEKKSFVITSLKSKVIGGVDVPEAAVEAFEPVGAKEITWNNDTDLSNMNDFVVAGVYDIKGERTRIDDNLPILNTGGGHTFNARLTVLDSSIERTEGEPQSDDKCITQVLSFSNRLGQGEVYIRTGKGSSLDNLIWENWSTLQRNVNVDTVTSLDHLIDNGIYSGVYVKNAAEVETFVMVVINNYAAASQKEIPKSVSQFKYSVSLGGSFAKYETRVGGGNPVSFPYDWEILNKDEITSMISAEIKKVNDRISTLIDDNDPDTLDSIKDLINWVNEHGNTVEALFAAIKANADKIEETIDYAGEEFTKLRTADNIIKAAALRYDGLTTQTTPTKVAIKTTSVGLNNNFTFDIPSATEAAAGVMTAEDKKALDAVVDSVGSLAVKKFYILQPPTEKDNSYEKIEKVSLSILGQQEDFFKLQAKQNGGVLERTFYLKDYSVNVNIPIHFVSYIYSEKEQEIRYQLYENGVGYLQNQLVRLNVGWNKLELEHTFETVPSGLIYLYLGKLADNDFYFYKTFAYNGITKANVITEHTNDELDNRLASVENIADRLQGDIVDKIIHDNENLTFLGKGNTYDYETKHIPTEEGDCFVIKIESIAKPEGVTYSPALRLQFFDEGNKSLLDKQFNKATDVVITAPIGTAKLTYTFMKSTSPASVLNGEYKFNGVTLIQKSRLVTRVDGIESRVESLEILSNDWAGKVLSTYGDSVTALQGGDFDIPYNETGYKWGNRVADYLKMSRHYGRGVGGQKYAWGTNGGSITWIEKATGIMHNRNDSFNLDNWDGTTFPSTWTDAQKNTVLNGLADGSIISVRGCMCSWLRITSMYPASIKDSVDVVFVMCHNDAVDGKEFSWVEGDTTDPEWALSEQYATYGGDYNIGTLEGGIASTIMKLQAWMPNAVIILGTPINGQGTTGQLRPDAGGLYKQVQHVKNVGLRFSIPVIDVYATCGINGLNRTDYITDTIHPYSVAGSKMIARAIIGGFKTILPKL